MTQLDAYPTSPDTPDIAAETISARGEVRAGVSFAVFGGELLRHLEVGSSGTTMRQHLTDAVRVLEAHEVRVVVGDDEHFTVNDVLLPPHVSYVWRSLFGRAGVSTVCFSRHTSQRELLLFAALLAAPGEPGAFQRIWLDCGAWRIQVCSDRSDAEALAGRCMSCAIAPDVLNDPARLGAAIRTGEAAVRSPEVVDALRRHGAEATRLLLAQLAEATRAVERRRLFEAIVAVGSGAEHLIAALEHPQWYVARNAAALLGELQSPAADAALSATLDHHDFRVRAAVATSLGQIGSDDALQGLQRAVIDGHARVRTMAWTAWAGCATAPPAVLLDAALRREDDEDVKRTLLHCAAAFPSLDVAAGLVRFCARECSRGQRSLELATFGVEQLALRRPSSAMAFVNRLPGRLGIRARAS